MKKYWSALLGLAGVQAITVFASANCDTPQEINASFTKNIDPDTKKTGYWDADSTLKKIQAECPELPWKEIRYIGDEIAKHDWAISDGTSNGDYIFSVYTGSNKAAAVASLECTTSTNLGDCIKELACERAGSYSMFCDNYPGSSK